MVLGGAAWDAFGRGDFDSAIALGTAAVENGVGADCLVPSWPYSAIALASAMLGDARHAEDVTAEATRALDQLGPRGFSYAVLMATAVYWESHVGAVEAARVHSRDALEIAERLRNPGLRTTTLSAYAQLWSRDDPDGALAALDEAIALIRRGAGDAVLGTSLSLSALILATRDQARSLRHLRESVAFCHGVGDQSSVVTCAHRGARIFDALDEPSVTAVLLGVVGGRYGTLASVSEWERQDCDAIRPATRESLGSEEYELAVARGAAMSLDEIHDFSVDSIDALLAEFEGKQ
jgi:hypothetical protein